MKRFQLMQRVNPEGLYGTVQACLPHFKKNGWKGRIIVVSPPIYSRFFRGKTAYAMGKVGMSVLTKGMAMDFEREGRKDMAITSIWPAAVGLLYPSSGTMLISAVNRIRSHRANDQVRPGNHQGSKEAHHIFRRHPGNVAGAGGEGEWSSGTR